MTKRDFSHRIGFLLTEAGRLYGRRFDQLARDGLTLSRAQCRALVVLAMQDPGAPLTQAALAEQLDVSSMAVAALCDRLEVAQLLRREHDPQDRRVHRLHLQASAHEALDQALALGDQVQAQALSGLDAQERTMLMALLQKVHRNLSQPTKE
jgi:DNA-binding MarR family transcriptional regulator